MRTTRRWLVAGCGLLALVNGGCMVLAASAVGGGAVGLAYATAPVERTFPHPPETCKRAADTALTDLGLTTRVQQPDGLETVTATGERVRLAFAAVPSPFPGEPDGTRLSVRVAVFGDEAVSRRILDQIALRLRDTTFTPPPGVRPPGGVEESAEPPLAKEK